ncbi:hypothetical protein ABT369_09045 [Dactylosporangium sp. NPDC000244]|uniref:hypothetical protein n=1 Tax=Dactylosporangium sp. NPDC000244 TaxID=3154365 RepID=UPI003328EE8E
MSGDGEPKRGAGHPDRQGGPYRRLLCGHLTQPREGLPVGIQARPAPSGPAEIDRQAQQRPQRAAVPRPAVLIQRDDLRLDGHRLREPAGLGQPVRQAQQRPLGVVVLQCAGITVE